MQIEAWPDSASVTASAVTPGSPPQERSREVGDTRSVRLAIPYLGPVPAPSRSVGRILRIGLKLAAFFALLRAVLFFQRAALDRSLTESRTADVVRSIHANQRMFNVVGQLGTLLIGGVLFAYVMWCRQRRPRAIAQAQGEAYVEHPLNWVSPIGLRLAMFGALAVTFLGFGKGAVPSGTPLADLASHRDWSAVGAVALAVAWALNYAMVVIADRRHDERVVRSAPERADPAAVPYFPMVGRARPVR